MDGEKHPVKRMFSHYSKCTRVVPDHISVRAWLDDSRLASMADIQMVRLPLYTRQLMHGPRMRKASLHVPDEAEKLRTSGVVKKAREEPR